MTITQRITLWILIIAAAVTFLWFLQIYTQESTRRDDEAEFRARTAQEAAVRLHKDLVATRQASSRARATARRDSIDADASRRRADSLSRRAEETALYDLSTATTLRDTAAAYKSAYDTEQLASSTLRFALDSKQREIDTVSADRDRWVRHSERADSVTDSLVAANVTLTERLHAHQCRVFNPLPCLGKVAAVAGVVVVTSVVISRLKDQQISTPNTYQPMFGTAETQPGLNTFSWSQTP